MQQSNSYPIVIRNIERLSDIRIYKYDILVIDKVTSIVTSPIYTRINIDKRILFKRFIKVYTL